MADYKAMIEQHSCKPNQGCGVMTICMCGVAEDMADEIERLRMLNAMTEVSHNQLASQIERLRIALEYIVEYCEETSLSREDKIAHTLRKARSALEEKE